MPEQDSFSGYVDENDAAYFRTVEDSALRDTMICTVTKYRRPDRLQVGDTAPMVELFRLDDGEPFRLAVNSDRPLALIFGSYT